MYGFYFEIQCKQLPNNCLYAQNSKQNEPQSSIMEQQQLIAFSLYRSIMENTNLMASIISILKGLRNGIYYGGKVRLVHSFVMMLLFKSISKSEIKNIIKLGFQHARNLGIFVFSYKASCILLAKIWGEKSINHFIAGFVFGGLIFGQKTPVNVQIVLYLLSRILLALVKLLYKKFFVERWTATEKPFERKYGHMILAAFCWGIVMWLFKVDKSTLQPSLTSSMQFLYVQSNKILANWRQLVPFYIPKF